MSQNSVDLYYTQNFNLAKTLCIKSSDSANGINNLLIATYGNSAVDQNTPTTWKYYLNISGQYHPTDTVMYVTSLDTLQQIEFTVANLANNNATQDAYQYGSRYYYSLLSRYPNQEQLILGILYPADINTAINADDGTILTYPSSLVQSQEVTLINELQQWLYNYLVRWNVKAFATSDDLYQTSYHAIMYLNILMKIINLRVKRCKTAEAHTFHIQEYLASNYGLDIYMQYLTLEQILFLYRNIKYIERHSGFSKTFNMLVNELLTKRNIPIGSYVAKLTSNFTNYQSTPSFDLSQVNTLANIENKTKFTYDEFIIKLMSLAPDNPIILNNPNNGILQTIQSSPSSTIQTKELESAMYDYTDAVPHKLTDILFNEWLHLSTNNLYNVYVTFTDPTSSLEYTLVAQDAFIYMMYIYAKACGVVLLTVPSIIATKVRKLTLPTASQMTSLCDSRYSNAATVAANLLSYQPAITSLGSINDFFNLCAKIFDAGIQEWYAVANEAQADFRAQLWNMADYQYEDTAVVFANNGQAFSTWLSNRDLPDLKYILQEYQSLITNIWNAATGISLINEVPFYKIQNAMISILTTLSSYSIQIIQSINKDPIILLNWGAIRTGYQESSIADEHFANNSVWPVDYSWTPSDEFDATVTSVIPNSGLQDITVREYDATYNTDYELIYLPDELYNVVTWQQMVAVDSTSVNQFSIASTLTASQMNSLPDIYQNNIL